jgi:Zn ribbon nucleic-acid-binding protein
MTKEIHSTSSGQARRCQNCKQNFTIESEDLTFYEKMKVPPPTWCPDCRAKRRLNFWNEHVPFMRKDSRTGKEIFSTFSASAPILVYERDYWWSDAWDPMQYGRPYDFSRPFFSQLGDLIKTVPWPSKSVRDMVNSDYSNQASSQKNCYLCFNGGYSEDCLYGVAFQRMMSSMDFYACLDCNQCCGIYQTDKSHKTFFSEGCSGCQNVWFSLNCTDCSNCFGCVNLRHKRYHIFNVPYPKEEYEKRVRELNLTSYRVLEDVKARFEEFRLRFPFKYMHNTGSTNVSGDYVYWSKNAHDCYEIGKTEDSRYVQCVANGLKGCYDYSNWGQNVELIYESSSCGDACQRLKFCFDCWPACRDLEYCLNCHSCSDLFGCVGLQKKQYCVFNVQYSADEYGELVSKIKQHMMEMPYVDKKGREYRYGESFPPEFSPTAYNESKAQDYYPLRKEEAAAEGYLWFDIERREYQTTISARDLPDEIADIRDSVVNEKIGCIKCGRAYRIIPSEIDLNRRFGLPVSRLCFACRYDELLRHRNPLKLWHRRCQCAGAKSENSVFQNTVEHHHGEGKCPNEFETSYAPDRKEIVYCESCYNAEVV